MHASRWPRFQEPLRRTLARNIAVAAAVAGVVATLRHDAARFLPFAVLALWPALGGHYVELAFLNGIRARIPPHRAAQATARLGAWAIGGVLLHGCMAATARALPVTALPLSLWWCGGLLFIGLELAVHAVLAVRGLSNVYDGRG